MIYDKRRDYEESVFHFNQVLSNYLEQEDIRAQETCHLVLVNHTPLSIRFRFDEKRFDVDGPMMSGRRSSSPGWTKPWSKARASALRSLAESPWSMHIRYLSSQGRLLDDLEFLDLDDLPDVRGLKAVRVGVDMTAAQMDNVIEMRAG